VAYIIPARWQDIPFVSEEIVNIKPSEETGPSPELVASYQDDFRPGVIDWAAKLNDRIRKYNLARDEYFLRLVRVGYSQAMIEKLMTRFRDNYEEGNQ